MYDVGREERTGNELRTEEGKKEREEGMTPTKSNSQ